MRIAFCGILLLTLCFASNLQAQDIFLKITGSNGVINGESLGMKDHIDGFSYAENASSACATSGSGGGTGSCQTSTGNFFFVIQFDKTLNALRSIMYKGQALPKIEITFRKQVSGSPFTYYTLRLDEVHIASISDAVSSGSGTVNTIQIEFNPAKFGWTYFPQPAGTGATSSPVKFGWDRSQNREWTGF